MSEVTSKELDELETMISHATPGPWCNVWLDRVYRSVDGWMAEHVSNSGPISHEPDATKYCAANARLIAALRNAAPALIAAARENADLRAKLAEADAACANHRAARKEADWNISTLKGFIAAADKARDEQAEAVRLLAREVRMWRSSCTYSAKEALRIAAEAREETQNNPIAAAAVKEAT
jgi:hypothetical protein